MKLNSKMKKAIFFTCLLGLVIFLAYPRQQEVHVDDFYITTNIDIEQYSRDCDLLEHDPDTVGDDEEICSYSWSYDRTVSYSNQGKSTQNLIWPALYNADPNQTNRPDNHILTCNMYVYRACERVKEDGGHYGFFISIINLETNEYEKFHEVYFSDWDSLDLGSTYSMRYNYFGWESFTPTK